MNLPPLSPATQNLFSGIATARHDLVDQALKNGADVTAYDTEGATPLHRVVVLDESASSKKILDLLLKELVTLIKKRKLKTESLLYLEDKKKGASALHWAAKKGSDWALTIIEQNNAAFFYLVRSPERTLKEKAVLHKAVVSGKTSTVQIVLRLFAHDARPDHKGYTPLHKAVAKGFDEITAQLMNNKFYEQVAHTGKGDSLFHLAVESRKLSTVRIIYGKYHYGIKNCLNQKGYTPEQLAIKKGLDDIVSFFFAKSHFGPSDSTTALTTKKGSTVLHLAVGSKKLSTVEIVANHFISANKTNGLPCFTEFVSNQKGQNPLHKAVRKGLDEIVTFFLNNGADANQPTANGQKPLELAKKLGHDKVVQAIHTYLEPQASIRRKNTEKVFMVISQYDAKEITTCLTFDVDLDTYNFYGFIPFHEAIFHRCSLPFLERLLSKASQAK